MGAFVFRRRSSGRRSAYLARCRCSRMCWSIGTPESNLPTPTQVRVATGASSQLTALRGTEAGDRGEIHYSWAHSPARQMTGLESVEMT